MNQLHLTRILLDYALTQKLEKPIRDAYDWHQRAWELFPNNDRQTREFLTRLDVKDDGWQLLILSPDAPVRPTWCPVDAIESKMISENFMNHTHYNFSLMANPTKTVKVFKEDGTRKKNGKREPIVKREDLLGWLQRKGDQHGFIIDPVRIKTIPRAQNHFYKEKSKDHGTLHGVDFQGTLQVTDPVKFKEAFCKGIGKAKAFGYGMLLLSPMREPNP